MPFGVPRCHDGGVIDDAAAPPRAYRNADEAMLGGVASGLAEHFGVPATRIRIAFVVATVVGGFGLILYAVLWAVLPARHHLEQTAPGLAAAERAGRRRGRGQAIADDGPIVALAAIAVGVALLIATITGASSFLWPTLLAVGGLGVLWRQADEAQRERWRDSTARLGLVRTVLGGGPGSILRAALGVVMVVAAITLFVVGDAGWTAARNVILAATLGVLGIGLIAAPWLLRMSADLREERAERVRSQERADMAAHLHDSVLQTLALIQRSAQDPAAVARLARAQERDLRSWLFGADAAQPDSVGAALRSLAAEVEDDYGVPVEVVCVGDRAVDEQVRAVLLATREAVVNAARHSGAPRVDLYGEIGAEEIEIFVRDRGRGFEIDGVAGDRHGVRESILGRMERHGGSAVVKGGPGQGTEVQLRQPLEAGRAAGRATRSPDRGGDAT